MAERNGFCGNEKNRPVNPYFGEALKENLVNNYCRTAAFEPVTYVYGKEADVLENWVVQCVKKKTGGAMPKEHFAAEQKKIMQAFLDMPFADMHPTELLPLQDALDRLLVCI